MSEEDDFDLNDLDDKELVEQIQDDLYDGSMKKSLKEQKYFLHVVGMRMMSWVMPWLLV